MKNINCIGIDLGATNIRGALVNGISVSAISSRRLNTTGTEQQVLDDVFAIADTFMDRSVKAIGIGVPAVLDVEQGIVYDVQHIPSWKEVPLKKLMEARYHIPVNVNNDANCFVLGEYYFGEGRGFDNIVGITLGTGLGAGIIINKQLYAGNNCGAGEFGMVDYLDHNYEYYCSGSFFQNVYGLNGEDVFKDAEKGSPEALKLYGELGVHLGNVIKLAMYAYDPQLIILGGSVHLAYRFFEQTMWKQVETFGYPKSLENLTVVPSALENSGVLGAAALCFDKV
jgi:glucokinase